MAREHHTTSPNPNQPDQLPNEVVTCLRNARFLHLATCTNNIPHVSLMNYTYLPSHSFPPAATHIPHGPTIIMTSKPDSKKTLNLQRNPHVSLLVHDWVSSRPPNSLSGADRERSPTGGPRSSLAAMLMQMNSSAVSSNSITMDGEASLLDVGSDEERWCKEQHLANNTYEDRNAAADVFRRPDMDGGEGDDGKGAYIESGSVRVVVVRIIGGRISDWKGNVKDWTVEGSVNGERLVNGVS